MACTIPLNFAPSGDFPMDAAIYHPTRNSLFTVRAGYVFEYSLALLQLNSAKFVNPCFSKSCMAYDSVNDKIWIGTNGDQAAGRLGDTGSPTIPSLSTAGLYRITPSTLGLDLFVDPGTIAFTKVGGGTFIPKMFGSATGMYDLIYSNAHLYGTLFSYGSTGSIGSSLIINPLNPSVGAFANLTFDIPPGQITYENINVPNRVWSNQDGDEFGAYWPVGTNVDGSGSTNGTPPFPPNANGAHGAIAFSSVGGGFLYTVEIGNTRLIKYNVNGTINSLKTLAGATIGGMTPRIRFNPNDNNLYIPCPATNQVIQYSPATDAVLNIFSGFDAPHDVVFSPTHVFALQFGSVGLKQVL